MGVRFFGIEAATNTLYKRNFLFRCPNGHAVMRAARDLYKGDSAVETAFNWKPGQEHKNGDTLRCRICGEEFSV